MFKIKNMKRIYSISASIALMAFVALFTVSCGGGSKGGKADPEKPDDPVQTGNTLHNFSFKRANNAGNLVADANAIMKDKTLYITVGESTDLTKLVPTFKVSEKATLKINNKEISNGVTAADFSAPTVTLTVVSESGKSNPYYLLINKGNATYDNYVYAMMRDYAIPGVSVAISKDEQIIYQQGYGYANTSTRERVNPNHLFRLASCSKAQTSLCIFRLYEAGKLTMDSKVFGEEGLLKDLFNENTEPFVAGVKDITVENLLYHNTGWNVEAIFDTYGTPYYNKTLDQRIDYLVHHQAFAYSRGSTYSYSNISYCILGRIIEVLSGKKFEDYLRETVAQAGVTDMWCSKTAQADKRANEVIYYPQNGTTGYQNDMDVVGACGNICTTPSSLVKLMCAQDYGTTVPDILQPSTLDVLYTVSPNYQYYAHGWRRNHSYYTRWASYHGGNLAGVGTFMVRGKNGVNMAIVCNSRSYNTVGGNSFDTALYVIAGNILASLGD